MKRRPGGGRAFDEDNNPTKYVILMKGLFDCVCEALSGLGHVSVSLKANWQKMSCCESDKAPVAPQEMSPKWFCSVKSAFVVSVSLLTLTLITFFN